METHCLYLKVQDDALFTNRGGNCLCTEAIKDHAQKCEVNRLSLQKLDYEMERADLPDDNVMLK